MWWATVTLTTVRYGDDAPESSAGRWPAAFVMAGGLENPRAKVPHPDVGAALRPAPAGRLTATTSLETPDKETL